MCVFSGPADVSKTKIFSRLEGGRQFLAYQMELTAKEDVAMILPIPTNEDIEFINLQGYEKFFDDLFNLFPRKSRGAKSVLSLSGGSKLAVHSVGAYEASFVPSVSHFIRLDERFRLPAGVRSAFQSLYGKHFGYAVFKLKSGNQQTIHPMAFSFKTGQEDAVFFPTVHVHDGEYHAKDQFDHVLYMQLPAGLFLDAASSYRSLRWERSRDSADSCVNLERACGVVRKGLVYKTIIEGKHDNVDVNFALRYAKVA